MKNHYNDLRALLIIILLGVLFQAKYINEFPSYIHAWTQSDRYALALGFVNNDLNFFKPETFSLLKNHQESGKWKYPSEESITAVDFPIHDYVPAIFMKIMGDKSPWLFRTYILLYGFLGLFFLYKLSLLWTKRFYPSILIVIFTATSPVFAYYHGGFLPTIPSLSNAFIGIFFYSKYLISPKPKYFNTSLVFLTLGTLARTPFAIPLIAVLGLELLRLFKKDSKLRPKILPVTISVSTIVFYFFYNKFLTQKYGAIFLANILPPRSFDEGKEALGLIFETWSFQYFSGWHYVLIAIAISGAIYTLISGKSLGKKEHLYLTILVAIIFVGCGLFSFLMLRQFVHHDYYFLDTFFLPIVLLLILCMSILPAQDSVPINRLAKLVVLLICVPLILGAVKSQRERRVTGHWDRTMATINNFQNADHFLDSLGISPSAKLLVIDAYATNIPLILMNRKGYPIINTKREYMIKSLEWDYDYIVIQNEFFLSDIYSVFPEIITKLTRTADNGKISVFTRADSLLNQELIGFLGLADKLPVLTDVMTYDTASNELWSNTQSSSRVSYSGGYSGLLTADMRYGLTYKAQNLEALTESQRTLFVSSCFLRNASVDCEVVVSIVENGNAIYYKTYALENILSKKGNWEKVHLVFQLPQVTGGDNEFALYLLNNGNTELYIDDFEFKLY